MNAETATQITKLARDEYNEKLVDEILEKVKQEAALKGGTQVKLPYRNVYPSTLRKIEKLGFEVVKTIEGFYINWPAPAEESY